MSALGRVGNGSPGAATAAPDEVRPDDAYNASEIFTERDRFLSTVAHEIRTPLTAVVAITDLIERTDTLDSPSKRAKYLRVLRANARQLSGLIDDLLELQSFQLSRLKLHFSRFGTADLLRDAADSVMPILQGKSQTLVLSTPVCDVEIMADRARLAQVLTNLLSNASKYSPPGSVIELQTDVHGGEFAVSVRDQGDGFAEGADESVFAPFFRDRSGTSRHVQGSGLGLTVARALVELHRGTISATNRPGEGAEVGFRVPGVCSCTPRAADRAPAKAEGRPASRRNSGGASMSAP